MNNVPDILINNSAKIVINVTECELRKKSVADNSNDEKKEFKRFNSFRRTFRLNRSFKRSKSTGPIQSDPELSDNLLTSRRAISMSPSLQNSPIFINKPIPAPLLVADPPSSEDGSEVEDLKQQTDPALLNGSSGNFGSAGAKSAPSTPHGLLTSPSTVGLIDHNNSQPCSPGYISPSIQRSPSHNLFTKYDKGTLKQLSSSTPAMTAQPHSPEPPSPKALAKEDKPTTSKAREKKFHRHFPSVEDDEKVLNYYSCALIGDILLQGHLYITKNYFAFYSNVFGYVTKLLIPMMTVQKITKEKTARIIPNAVGIATVEDKHVFGSLMSRDNTYRLMTEVWDAARNSYTLVEPEILDNRIHPSEFSDSSETREESERDSVISETNARFRKCTIKATEVLETTVVDGDLMAVPKNSNNKSSIKNKSIKDRLAGVPKHNLFLIITTLILIFLFLSAAILLYRIGKVQHKYTFAFQDSPIITGSNDMYNELLQWQTHLHSKSAGAVHNFLDSNLDQIAKVRQSLEALSTLLMPNDSDSDNQKPKPSTTTTATKKDVADKPVKS